MIIKRKSFTLLEIIFAITVIAIMAMVAIPNVFSTLDRTNIIKLKSDIALIRSAIKTVKNQATFKNDNTILTKLDDDNKFLFKNILTQPIISKEASAGSWSKMSDTQYKAWVDADIFVLFTYNKTNGNFDCDFTDLLCQELTQ